MLLPTKHIIRKIESLSNDLTPQQLAHFLDIIDAMTALVEEAKSLAEEMEQPIPEVSQLYSDAIH